MNTQKIQQLIDYMKQLPDELFNMRYMAAYEGSNLVCGIDGLVCLLEGEEFYFGNELFTNALATRDELVDDFAAEVLDLSSEQVDWLIYGGFVKDTRLSRITKQQAIEALEHLLAGGELCVLFEY